MSSRRRRRNRNRDKGRSESGSFASWPHQCAQHPNFHNLSFSAKALLLYFMGEFKGFNNGDLSCAWELAKNKGWSSKTTIAKACSELERTGWIVRTRQGFRNVCNLYALTFHAIDDCKGKLAVNETKVPLGFWKTGNNPLYEQEKAQRPKPNSFAKARKWPRVGQNLAKSPSPNETGQHCVTQNLTKSGQHEALG